MRILIINYEYPPVGGGGGVICRDIAEELVKMGHEITVITSQYNGLNDEEMVEGVNIIRVPVWMRKDLSVATIISMLSYVPSCILKANKLLRQKQFDVINTHFAIPSGPAGQYISTKHKIPNILTIHGGDLFDPSKSLSPHKTFGLKQTVRRMLHKADDVVAQSSDTKRNAQDFYHINRDIKIIPLGIKQNVYPAKKKSELGLPEDKLILSTIGRLLKRKDYPETLQIINRLKDQIPVQLLIMGEGPEEENIRAKINELNLQDSVTLLGRVNDEEKFQYLSVSDIYVSTAIHEGFGIVFLEAMECGLPVVCYNRGGQADFLQDGKTGFLIELGDVESFSLKLGELLKHRDLREKISEFNKDYVKKFYIANITREYEELFRRTAQATNHIMIHNIR